MSDGEPSPQEVLAVAQRALAKNIALEDDIQDRERQLQRLEQRIDELEDVVDEYVEGSDD